MEPAQSINKSVHASLVSRSTSCEARCNYKQKSIPHAESSFASNEMYSIEAIQNAASKQRLFAVHPRGTQLSDYRQAPDQQLIEAAGASDERAFAELSRRFQGLLRNKVFRIVRNREDADDIVQEALMKAYKHLGEFRGSSSFSTWLTKIAINSALMVLRKKRTRSEVPLDWLANDEQTWEIWEFPDPFPNPEQTYAKCEVLDFVSRIIDRLPPAHRDVIELHYRHECSIQECADVVGITVNATKSRLLRARLTIRSALAKRRAFHDEVCC